MLVSSGLNRLAPDTGRFFKIPDTFVDANSLLQPLNNKSEIENRLEFEVNQLNDVLSQVKFTKTLIKTSEISTEIEGLCATIIDFLVHALKYQKKWSILKVMGVSLRISPRGSKALSPKSKDTLRRLRHLPSEGTVLS